MMRFSKIPETPIWLLSKNRPEEAERALQCLRGGVGKDTISNELNQLKQILELTKSCAHCSDNNASAIDCGHKPVSVWGKFGDLIQKRTIKPFILIVLLFLIMQFTGMMVMRPYYVQILDAHGVSVSSSLLISIFGVLGILANICIMLSIRMLGKRKIYLYSMVLNCISSFGMSKSNDVIDDVSIILLTFFHNTRRRSTGIYGFYFLPLGWLSTSDSSAIQHARDSIGNYGYVAVVLFVIMHFCVSVGISSIPYFLLGEVFPFK